MVSIYKVSEQMAASQSLKGSYVVGDRIIAKAEGEQYVSVEGQDVGSLTLVYTTGAGETDTTARFRLEFSHDGTDWFPEQKGTETGGVDTLTPLVHAFGGGAGATAYKTMYNFQSVARFLRVAFLETGIPRNAGSIDCDLTLGSGVGYFNKF